MTAQEETQQHKDEQQQQQQQLQQQPTWVQGEGMIINDDDALPVNDDEEGDDDDQRVKLDELPYEMIFKIFDYLHAHDLVRLSSVCTTFYQVARDRLLWEKRSHDLLVTNQKSDEFVSRCNPALDSVTKWQVSHNWMSGCFDTDILSSTIFKVMPCIKLTRDVLWWAGGNMIYQFPRSSENGGSVNKKQKCSVYVRDTGSDVTKFVVVRSGQMIVSGHRDGALRLWRTNPAECLKMKNNIMPLCTLPAHSSDLGSVAEAKNQVLFTGSRNGTVKAWEFPHGRVGKVAALPLETFQRNDCIWSLATDPSGDKLAIGTGGNFNPALYVCDTSSFQRSHEIVFEWRGRNAGILDMVWENPQTLLTCGYDTCVRKWDLRSGRCVSAWSDPTGAAVFCISTDYNFTMVTGSQFNCKAVLWDQRKPDFNQLYFMHLRRMCSPVYSIAFDSCHLYGATDQNFVELKFAGRPSTKKNFRDIMNYAD
ncbi:F-box/WD repeat-containing protein 4 isoform X1 [Trichogramma pretiosum]|uniref:F-box/WD repeat-containing protein 4 isoform X1 n=1 Tax=Trichogramma pretiosum TaxID=7493 RepID=UPI0006C99D9F|nr:F-box/WD repeat-containing protein 4 isoform X1 [Trichogramma pretiosum]